MAFIFVPLETISYSFRAVSLGVRLWVNMLAGHTLLHILTGAGIRHWLRERSCGILRPILMCSQQAECVCEQLGALAVSLFVYAQGT